MKYKRKILIVDPDAKIREEYLSFFSDDDCKVEACTGITNAVAKIRDGRFDCIIMDVNLPDMKGYEAVQIIKTIDPKVQIIITAVENTRELEVEVRKQDIFYYYIKSFDREELKLAVNNVFNKLDIVKENKKMNEPAKILIVDDDPDFVDATKVILEQKDYEVETAYNRSEAMEKIGQFKPHLILLDIMMDKLTDGFTICYQLKHDSDLKHTPVLAISGISSEIGIKFSPKTDGEYFEADDYAEKPINPDDLLLRVEKLLNK